MKQFPFILVLSLLLTACSDIGVYEKNAAIPEHQWATEFVPEFRFNVADTNAFYNVSVVLRHQNAYPYSNIWVELGRREGEDSLVSQRLNLVLGNNEGWYGTGMDDIFEHRIPVTPEGGIKMKAGEHVYTLKHIMRKDPLPHIMNAGIRIEKIIQAP